MAFPVATTSQANVALCSLVTLRITRVILWLGIQLIAYLSLKPAITSCFSLLTNAMETVSNFKFTPVKVKPDDKLKYQLKEALMVPSISLVRFLWTTWETSDSWMLRTGKGSFQVSWEPSVKKRIIFSPFMMYYVQQNVCNIENAYQSFIRTSIFFIHFFFGMAGHLLSDKN